MSKSIEGRNAFLNLWVRTLIQAHGTINTPLPEPTSIMNPEKKEFFPSVQPKDPTQSEIKRPIVHQLVSDVQVSNNVPIQAIKDQNLQNPVINSNVQINSSSNRPQQLNRPQQTPPPIRRPIQLPRPIPTGGYEALAALPSLSPLIPYLQDPSIQLLECPGPGKQIIAVHTGITQTTGITFSDEAIKNLMEEVSKYTKIPLVGGFFKAAVGPVLITVIQSEHIGSRFIVQKKPQSPLAPKRF